MVLAITLLHLKSLNKMELLKGKKWYLEEITRTILNESPLLKYFYVDVMNVAYYVSNKTLLRPIFRYNPLWTLPWKETEYISFAYLWV